MPRALQRLFAILIAALLVGGPVGYGWYRQARLRNFRVVREGVLYRSGQLSLAGLQRLLHDYGINTVVTLRDATHPGDGPPDLDEELYCKKAEIKYVRIAPREWWASDGSVPAEKGVARFREIMKDPRNYPVLIHCYAGIHRTGAFCAVYRMEFEHWTNAQAIDEMKAYGYTTLTDDWDLLTYLESYQPSWQKKVAQPNPVNWSKSFYRGNGKKPRRPSKHSKPSGKKTT
jgi:hypothetical protein